MTFCGYTDIYDYCRSNEYTYYYGEVIALSGNLVPNKDYSAPIIREFLGDGSKIIITPDTQTSPEPCDQYDSGDILSDWECYQIWKNDNETQDPPLSVYQDYARASVENTFNEIMSQGYTLTINDNIITIPRDTESQNNIINALMQSIISNTDPMIQDTQGNRIAIPRTILQNEIQSYIKSNQQLSYNKNQALSNIEDITVSEELINIKIDTNTDSGSTCAPGYSSDNNGGCIDNSAIP